MFYCVVKDSKDETALYKKKKPLDFAFNSIVYLMVHTILIVVLSKATQFCHYHKKNNISYIYKYALNNYSLLNEYLP